MALMDFVIAVVGLFVVGAMVFAAMEFISTDPRFKKIATIAVGGILVLLFLVAVKGVLFGGAGAAVVTPAAILWFAIDVIAILVVWFLIDLLLNLCTGWFPPIGPFMAAIKFVVAALVLIAILVAAADMLTGGAIIGGVAHRPFLGIR